MAEILVDFLLQARARLCDNNVNGAEDKIVSEMLKRLPLATVCEVAESLHIIGCQHLWVLATHLLEKHWEWQENRNG